MMERTAWLFTKHEASVRLELRTTRDAVQLVIDGPGASTQTYDFEPGIAVSSFREEYEKKLLADGYRLQVVSERRTDDEGTSPSPPIERRRR